MVAIPAADFDFAVSGVVIEGYAAELASTCNIPGKMSRAAPSPPAGDSMPSRSIAIRSPTRSSKAFLDASGYAPADAQNFLAHWIDGAPPAGWDEQARSPGSGSRTPAPMPPGRASACRANGNGNMPRKGTDGRRYPWGDDWRADAVPAPCLDRRMPDPADRRRASGRGKPVRGRGSGRHDLAMDRRISRRATCAARCCAAAAPISRRPRIGISRRLMR